MKDFNKKISSLFVAIVFILATHNSFAQSPSSKTEKQWYNIANGVWEWHKKKENGSLLVVSPQNTVENKGPYLNLAPRPSQSAPIDSAFSQVQRRGETPTVQNTVTSSQSSTVASPNLKTAPVSNTQPTEQSPYLQSNLTAPLQDNNPANKRDTSALKAQLPTYKTNKEQAKQYLEQAKTKAKNTLNTVNNYQPADPSLPKKQSKVAYLPVKKEFLLPNTASQLKDVSILNIGREAQINKNDFIDQKVKDLTIEYKTPPRLKSPIKISRTVFSEATNALKKARNVKKLKGKRWKLGKVVKNDEVTNLTYTIKAENSFQELPVDPLTKYDVFLLSAIILNSKKIYPPALGLFDEVTKSEKHRQEASFYMGKIAYKLKLYSEAAHRLIPIVLKPNEFRSKAISILLQDFPKEHESKIALSLSKMEDRETLPPKFMNKILYYISKHEFDTENYKTSSLTADQVSLKSDYYVKARFIKGLSEYFSNDLNAAMSTLTQLQSYLANARSSDTNIESLLALNLGRIYFQQKKYKESYHSYKKIDKSHPLWLQAVTELGWVQLALGDQFGAIGNMYSLHSPYFSSIYKPETYAIKTIGYLNICQYADAYKSLSLHEKDYRDWKNKIDAYVAKNTSPGQVYKTVSKYLSGNSSTDVDGLPYQVIREIARQKTFLNIQKNINSKVDESKNYNKALSQFTLDSKTVKKKLASSKKALKNTKVAIAENKKTNQLDKLEALNNELQNLKDYITSYYFQLRIFSHSRKKLNQLKVATQARIKKENISLTRRAGQKLLNHIRFIKSDNDGLLDNNELLRYEVFSGSGENIRYQVTGGKIKNENRIPASVKPRKSLNWDFSGEFWEDEIGSYRTTLVDKCPKN